MKYDPEIHRRRSIRYKDFDYTQPGAYFFTLVTRERANLFGRIDQGVMDVNRFGEIIHRVWLDLPRHYPYITLDWFVLMPNHVHAIIFQNHDDKGRGGSSLDVKTTMLKPLPGDVMTVSGGETCPYKMRRHGLSEIVRALKSFSARRINQIRSAPGQAVWQRNYFERIIRNQKELDAIREYITDNPRRWTEDKEYRE